MLWQSPQPPDSTTKPTTGFPTELVLEFPAVAMLHRDDFTEEVFGVILAR
jgi:hypothetical protein